MRWPFGISLLGVLSSVVPVLAQTVNLGILWTDNRGEYEIQNYLDKPIYRIVVTYERLGKTTISERSTHQTIVCGGILGLLELGPKEK